jgi:hypothetical protein
MPADKPNADRPTLSSDEVEITPAMVAAALPHLYAYHPETGVSDEETVRAIYRAARLAMVAAT